MYLSGDAEAWAAYRAYLYDTSVLIPLPPALYRPLPKIVKRTILLDLPLYRFDESEAAVANDAATRAESSAEN